MGNELNNKKPSIEDLSQKVRESLLSESDKNEILSVINGEKLANLYRDTIAKRVFSPDLHPDRLDFLLKRIMKDDTIETLHSASNEGILKSTYSKKIITDLPAWIRDHRRADLEVQAAAQEYIYNRADIYSSEMLMVQYSASEGVDKDEIGYGNVNGVIIVVLMVKSPKAFKDFESDRYIHRITRAVADSGMEFKMLRQMAFVQLDKALELFLSGNYNKDEDVELLKMLAMIADINNDKVIAETKDNSLFDDIREEVAECSKDKEVQAMLLEEKMAILDWEANRNDARREGREQTNEVYAWLHNENRDDDIIKAISDGSFFEKMLKEYESRN